MKLYFASFDAGTLLWQKSLIHVFAKGAIIKIWKFCNKQTIQLQQTTYPVTELLINLWLLWNFFQLSSGQFTLTWIIRLFDNNN